MDNKNKLRILVAEGEGVALSSIVHGEIPSVQEARERETNKEKEGEPLHFRKETIIIPNKDGTDGFHTVRVPVCSGNMFRGIGRRLLVDFTFNALGIERSLADLFKGDYETARRVAFFLRVGGLTPKETKKDNVEAGTYEELRSALPTLALFGGVYSAHHFEGELACGHLIPLIKETARMFGLPEAGLPSLGDIDPFVVRYSRRAEEERSGIDEKESMPFGVEALPAGTRFIQEIRLVTRRDASVLAFRAMLYLIERYALLKGIGGMTARGHGKLAIQYRVREVGLDGTTMDADRPGPGDLEAYKKWLVDNKEAVINAIRAIPAKLPWSREANSGDNGSTKNRAKKGDQQ